MTGDGIIASPANMGACLRRLERYQRVTIGLLAYVTQPSMAAQAYSHFIEEAQLLLAEEFHDLPAVEPFPLTEVIANHKEN